MARAIAFGLKVFFFPLRVGSATKRSPFF